MIRIVSLIMALNLLSFSYATDGRKIAKDNGIIASSKASAQWERKYGKDREPFKGLKQEDKDALLDYLKSHAADSNMPEAAGL